MSSYQVRPAVAGDAESVAALHVKASQAAYQGLIAGPNPTLPVDQRRSFWREAIEFSEPQVHIAMQDGGHCGFTGFDRSRDPRTKPTTGEIWAIYVDPAHWGHGAGLALWDAAREGLLEEGCTEVTLWIPLLNDRALRFFELAGFKREINSARTALLGGVKIEEIRLRRLLA